MEFIKPKLPTHEFPSGVYEIIFDDKWLYIGSSVNIKKRFVRWKAVFKNQQHFSCKKIKKILMTATKVEFSILEVCDNYIEREKFFIQEQILNPYLLNNNNPLLGKIGKFSLTNMLLATYTNINEAADKNNLRYTEVYGDLMGKRYSINGYRFKIIEENGNIIEHEIKLPKKLLTYKKAQKIRQLRAKGLLLRELSLKFNISMSMISNIAANKFYIKP